MVLLREAGGFARKCSGRRLTHEKITHIRMGQMILGVAVVLACLAGMTWWATNMILKNEDLQAYIKKMEANQEDTNATGVNKPEGLPDATKTPEETVYQEENPNRTSGLCLPSKR